MSTMDLQDHGLGLTPSYTCHYLELETVSDTGISLAVIGYWDHADLLYFILWRRYKLVNPGCWFCCISNPYLGIRYTRYSRASQPYSLIFYYCPISGMQCDTRWPASYHTATQETSIDFQTKLSVQQGVCRGILNRKQPVILLDSAPLLFWAWAGE